MYNAENSGKLSDYLKPLLETFNDKRVVEKVGRVASQMVALNTVRLWTLAYDKREFERMKTLFDGSLQ